MDSLWINTLVRENIRNMTPYQSARKIGGKGTIFLNANELPDRIAQTSLNRYPEPQPKELKMLYSQYAGVNEDSILVTRGADEGIELLIRTFCEPKQDNILICSPTYGMYGINANAQDVGISNVPLIQDDFSLNLPEIKKAIERERIPLIFMCNPNNPTATSVSLESIKSVIEMALNRAIVVIDEAYIEFSNQPSAIGFLSKFPHVVILRTLSKAFGLAGARCGFILANTRVIEAVSKIIAPYPIPQPVVDAVIPYLSEDKILTMKSHVNTVNSLKESLSQQLKGLSIVDKIASSETNYLLVFFKENVFDTLCNKGVILRDQSFNQELKNAIRITIGDESENQSLINALVSIEQNA